MFNKFNLQGKKIVCLVSGGNIDVSFLNRVVTRGLIMSGRRSTITVELADRPGQLLSVSEIISRCGGNVVTVYHDRSDPNMAINSCFLRVVMETRDREQAAEIKQELINAGMQLVGEKPHQ
ncbi:L-threonine ammonia-lyase [bioreactor metagenome]|uniref:L-threonine ammonia-lyase n=1 Tax=bioreactor metagenome TaxID=1076179 RepID=A0A645HTN0_9ZZZZ